MSGEDLIERFAAEYHDYHGLSADRRRDQLRVLRALEDAAGKPLDEVEASDLSRWFRELISGGMAPTTVRKYRGLVAPWIRWAWRSKIIDGNRYMELKDVPLPRGAVSQSAPKPYTRDEIKKLWRDIDRAYPWSRDEKGRRFASAEERVERADYFLARWRRGTSDYRRVAAYAQRLQIEAIVAVTLCGALRRDETFNLTLDGMDPANAYLVAEGAAKNPQAVSRPRAVPWTTPYMRTAVERWLLFRAELAPDHDRPWLSLWGPTALVPLRHRRYEVLLSRIGAGWEFRRLRHTGATEMLRAGYPLHEVQRILGHSRLEQTLAYAELLPDDVVRTAARHEPTLSSALLPSADAPTGVAA